MESRSGERGSILNTRDFVAYRGPVVLESNGEDVDDELDRTVGHLAII